MIWENGIETCILSCKKQITSLCLMQDTGCLGLVHGDDPERWYGKMALKHANCHMWNESPVQVRHDTGCSGLVHWDDSLKEISIILFSTVRWLLVTPYCRANSVSREMYQSNTYKHHTMGQMLPAPNEKIKRWKLCTKNHSLNLFSFYHPVSKCGLFSVSLFQICC